MAETQTATKRERDKTETQSNGLRRALDWVVSYPKSGNTWIRLASMIYATGRPDMQALGKGGDMQVKHYHPPSPFPLRQIGLPVEMQIRPTAMLNLALDVHPQTHLLKSHHAFGEVAGIHLWQPGWTRKVINPVRDPREVCCSVKDHFGHDTYMDSAEFMAREGATIGGRQRPLHHFLSSWSSHVEGWLEASDALDVLTVRYEDLHDQVYGGSQVDVSGFYDIMDFILDEDVNEERLGNAVRKSRFNRLQEIEKDTGFPEQSPQHDQFFRSGRIDGWREELPSDVARKIEDDHGGMMKRLNYL